MTDGQLLHEGGLIIGMRAQLLADLLPEIEQVCGKYGPQLLTPDFWLVLPGLRQLAGYAHVGRRGDFDLRSNQPARPGRANLARLETRIALEEFMRRFPSYAVEESRCERVHMSNVHGYASVPFARA